MFRTFARKFLPNPFDRMLKKCARRSGKKVLLCWNRGLGDIALGLFAMTQRIREYIPDAEITFLTRENLLPGFSMLEGVKTIAASDWKRGETRSFPVDRKEYDLIIEKPDPTEWVRWQLGKVVPKLKWDPSHDNLWEKFDLPKGFIYIGVQVSAETNYGLWRNWPLHRWQELFDRLSRFKKYRILLFGFGEEPKFNHDHIIDLRGKTNLFELLSIIKNRCSHLILPDSGILSMSYYLDAQFPLQILSLWADSNHGILKQNVPSPNQLLRHVPLIGALRDLNQVTVDSVIDCILPLKPLMLSYLAEKIPQTPIENAGAILLAGGQGTRLGFQGPKGVFSVGGKSLFEWICEKAPRENFPIAVMTSPLNHEETVSFFKKNHNFGRELYFFKQPLGTFGPDGNGSVFKAFVQSGLDVLFASRGIDLINFVQIDNPLADPADASLIAHHRTSGAEATIKFVERIRSDESMGVLVAREGNLEIVEYLDLNPAEQYRYNYTGMMAMNLSFIRKIALIDLPLHPVRKKIDGKWVLKGERFIFDSLKYAEKTTSLCYTRESCYAPLKSLDQLSAIEKLLERNRS